jgi:hypothetical protein
MSISGGGNMTIAGTVDGRDISVDGTALDNLVTTIGLSALTTAEVDQLENINSTVISSTQWGYLGAMDQGIITTSDVQFNTGVIDSTSTTALVVRKNNSGATVFRVDTSSGNIYLGASEFYGQDTTNPLLNFDTNDYLEYDRTANEYRFRVGGTSALEINANEILVNANKLNISGAISGSPSGVGKYLSIPASVYTDNTTTTSGTASIMVFNEFAAPTLSALNPSIITTDTATVYIGGAPIAGTNETITNAYSLWIDSGKTRLDGDVVIDGTLTVANMGIQSYGLTASNYMTSPIGTFGTSGRSGSPSANGVFLSVSNTTFTDNTTTTSGTASIMAFSGFVAPTLSALNPSITTTDATTVYISGAPIAGSNQTITNAYSLWIDSGNVRIDGNIIISGTVDGRDISADGIVLDNLNTNGASALTIAEIDQLENINSTVISSTQWGYLGALDQDIATTSNVQFNTGVIDSTSTTALVVRKNNSGATVFRVDTSSGNIYLGANQFYAQDTTNPLLNFDTNDNLEYNRTNNEYKFIIGNASIYEIKASGGVIIPTTQVSDTVNVTSSTGGSLNIGGDTTTPRIYTYGSTSAPTFTNRSIGTRIVLASEISASTVDYSIGIESGGLWTSVPTTSDIFKWYGGTTQMMSLTGTVLTLDVKEIIDTTNTEALLVRKNGSGGDVFVVDTSNNITTSTDVLHIRPTSSGGESSTTFYANSDKSISVAGDRYTMGHNTSSVGTKNWSLANNIGRIIDCKSDRTVIMSSTSTSISVTTGALQVVGGIGIGGDSIFGGTVNGRNITTDGGTLDNLNTTIGLSALTTAEVDQLENINSTVISSTQWGYLGALDQGITTTSDIQFNTGIFDATSTTALIVRRNGGGDTILSVDTTNYRINMNGTVDSISSTTGALLTSGGVGIGKSLNVGLNIGVGGTVDGRDISVDGTALDNLVTTIGLSALTTVEVDQLENINSTVISSTQWGYLGAMDQGITTASNVQFNTAIIDATSATALVVRKDNSGSTILSVDTLNGGVVSIQSTIESTTTSIGSLIISGGVGIVKDVRIGGNLYVGGSQVSSGISSQASFVATNNQSVLADVTGLLFTSKAIKVWLTVTIDATVDLYEFFELSIVKKGATWGIFVIGEGDDSLVDFSITSGGQIQYTSGNISGHVSTTFDYKYIEIV